MPSRKKNVVISGGSSGIGLALVKAFAARGDHVHSFDVAPLPERIANATGVIVDITDWNQIQAAMQAVGGTIDVLINNAGVMHRGEYFETTQEEWNDLVAVHLTGCYGMVREAHPYFSKHPLIVQISSRHARNPRKNPFAYSLMKQATTALAEDIACHYPEYTVKTAFLGPVDTPLAYAGLTAEQIREKKIKDPAHSPSHVAQLILQLMDSKHSALVFTAEKRDYDFA